MIIIKDLQWSNCFSYGADNHIALNDNAVTQILGLNGSGKSSIPLIIEEALFNKNSKGVKKVSIPNRFINDGYAITVVFLRDSTEYEVSVQRTNTLKVTLKEEGKDISSHTATGTYATLQSILGLDYKTFSQLVYQSPTSSLQFLTATDTTRKKFLIDLLHLEEYVKFFEIFKGAAKEVYNEITATKSKLETIEKWLNDNKLTDATILPPLNLEIETEDDENELRRLTRELENISESNKKIIKNNQYRKLLKNIDLREIQDITITKKKSYDEMQTEIGNCNAVMNAALQQIRKLKGLKDVCPTCEQKVDENFVGRLLEEEKNKHDKAEAKRQELAQQIYQIKEDNKLFDKKTKLQKEWEDLYRSIDQSLESELYDEDAIKASIIEVDGRIQKAKRQLREAAAENEKRAKHNTRIQVINEQTDKFLAELNTQEEILEAKNGLFSTLEVLKKAFSTNGLLAYKIENLVEELEDLTNMYLGELSDGRFTLEFVVSNDKLNVVVTDNGKSIDIINLSSGELARVNTATLLAIRKLMSSISKSRLNILFLDEVINVLDETGREKLVEILCREDGLNTYIVSHGWSHPLLSKIEVVKENNISRLEQ